MQIKTMLKTIFHSINKNPNWLLTTLQQGSAAGPWVGVSPYGLLATPRQRSRLGSHVCEPGEHTGLFPAALAAP